MNIAGVELLASNLHTGAVLGQQCRGDRRDEVPGSRGRWHVVDREGPWDDLGGVAEAMLSGKASKLLCKSTFATIHAVI